MYVDKNKTDAHSVLFVPLIKMTFDPTDITCNETALLRQKQRHGIFLTRKWRTLHFATTNGPTLNRNQMEITASFYHE